MTNVLVWEGGQKVVREATLADLPEGHIAAKEILRASMSLTRVQTMIALVDQGFITEAEAEASATTVPAAVEAAIQTLPEAQRTPARLRWLNFTVALRNDPMIALLATIPDPDLTPDQIDGLFQVYGAI